MPSAASKQPPKLEQMKSLIGECEDWFMPDRSYAAEKRSFEYQAQNVKHGESPFTEQQLETLADRVAAMYPSTPSRQWSHSTLLHSLRVAISNLKRDASPGYPYMRWGRLNGDLLDTLGEEWLVGLAYIRMIRLLTTPSDELKSLSARELVEKGYVDPVRLFVKNELHSGKKVQQGRFRLIMSVSVVDQLVDRVLSSRQNSTEIDAWKTIPSKPGMGLNDDGLEALDVTFNAMRLPAATDMSGWDWTVKFWMLWLEATIRGKLGGESKRGGKWDTAYHRRTVCIGRSLFIFTDGEMREQLIPGVVKSGLYNTSSGNSRIRATLHVCLPYLLGMELPKELVRVSTMGDDCVEDLYLISVYTGLVGDELMNFVQNLYTQLGVSVKEITLGHPVEFCAYKFHGFASFEPVRWNKMVATFAASWPVPCNMGERKHALMYELRHSPHKDRVLEAIETLELAAPSGGGGANQAANTAANTHTHGS